VKNRPLYIVARKVGFDAERAVLPFPAASATNLTQSRISGAVG
jgi:hypothetical protein